MTTFADLALAPALLKAVEVLGFETPTPVQAQSIPPMLDGRDVIARAKTGSGKTVAFGLALLTPVDTTRKGTQALVLCPTRELADQVSEEIRRLARFVPNVRVVTLTGGVPKRTQTPALQRPPEVIVGTPGRILDHLGRDNLDLEEVRTVVLDEADRMLDMGFADDMGDILAHVPHERQTLLFSATFPDTIRELSGRFQNDPVEVTVDTAKQSDDIDERFFTVNPTQKPDAIAALLLSYAPESALIFCHTKIDTRELQRDLFQRGFSVLALHGDMEQRDRDEVMLRFANKSCRVLVATDVAARGLDVKELGAVISYELPQKPDVHVHRIGRTGRAGARGVALHLCAPKEKGRAQALETARGAPLVWERLPRPERDAKPLPADMVTLEINAGKKDKLRPGDILGALSGDIGLDANAVGKIKVQARVAFVAVHRDIADAVLRGFAMHKVKGRRLKARRMH